jgi:hypothetical protein
MGVVSFGTHFHPLEVGSMPFDTTSISACRRVRIRHAHVPGRSVEDPQPALVGVDHVGDAVALEVEHRRAGDRRAVVVVRRLPEDVDRLGRVVRLEHRIERRAGHADLRQAVAVEVRDRRRSAVVRVARRRRERHRAEQHGARGAREDPDRARRRIPCGVAHEHHLRLAVLVEVGDRREAVGQGRVVP